MPGHLPSNAVQLLAIGGTKTATSAGPKVGVLIHESDANKNLDMVTYRQCRE